jgi:hypothetical protein
VPTELPSVNPVNTAPGTVFTISELLIPPFEPGFHPCMVPANVSNRNVALTKVPAGAGIWKSLAVELKTVPVGPPATLTVSPCLIGELRAL